MAEHKSSKEQRYDRQLRYRAFTIVDGHKSRKAQAATELLQELNSDVSGKLVEEDADKLLENDPSSLTDSVWSSVFNFQKVESHPDSTLEDLRLDAPFTELRNHINSLRLGLHGQEGAGAAHSVRSIRKNENGVPEEEENFDEAIKNVNTALNPTKICSSVEEIFSSEQCENITSQHPITTRQGITVVAGAVVDGCQGPGCCARDPLGLVWDRERPSPCLSGRHCRSLGGKSAAFLRVLHCRSLSEEYSVETINKDEITSCMDNPDSEMVLYLMLRSVDRFYQQHSRYPVAVMELQSHTQSQHYWEELQLRKPSNSSHTSLFLNNTSSTTPCLRHQPPSSSESL
ncbi:hypothetical protein AMELA_G00030400 [Ameiurus melas]|uniref:Uncharacterized protein n=1 Tax=Ameiurus melas TaxID=219545 RepID=A0A7J6B8U8_AMEME|nr:hypothetical protein AMELA_G00030400 [Ameiurus melas]